MKLRSVRFQNFTVFADVTFEFAPGVNVLIGENGTGKSHVMKALYAICEFVRRGSPDTPSGYLIETFLPDDAALGRLIRRGSSEAHLELGWDQRPSYLVNLSNQGTGLSGEHLADKEMPRSIFLPPREVISIYPGFISAWKERYSAFDRTYFDLCVALNARPLRRFSEKVKALLSPLEAALGGKVVFEHDHFYVDLPDGSMEMPLLAEGLRKIATVAYLLVNGMLAPGDFLFWDEPEANMNPKLVLLLKGLILGLARAGVQVFFATHDFLLSAELSLAAKYEAAGDLVRFFALTKSSTGIVSEAGRDLGELKHNPIVEEFGAHYDREADLFARATRGEHGDPA